MEVIRIYYPSRRTVYSHLFGGCGVQCGFTGHVNDKAQALEQQPTPLGENRVKCTLYTHSDFSTKNLRKLPTSKLGYRGEGND